MRAAEVTCHRDLRKRKLCPLALTGESGRSLSGHAVSVDEEREEAPHGVRGWGQP